MASEISVKAPPSESDASEQRRRWRLLIVLWLAAAMLLGCFAVYAVSPIRLYEAWVDRIATYGVDPQLARWVAALPALLFLWSLGDGLKAFVFRKRARAFAAASILAIVGFADNRLAQPKPGELFNPVTGEPNFRYTRGRDSSIELFPRWQKVSPHDGRPLNTLTPGVADEYNQQQQSRARALEARQTPPDDQSGQTSTSKASTIPANEKSPTPRRASSGGERPELLEHLINTSLSLSSSQPNIALLIEAQPADTASVGEGILNALARDHRFRIVGNVAPIDRLQTTGLFDNLYAGGPSVLKTMIERSRIDYLLLVKTSYSCRSQPSIDPELLSCNMTLACKLADRSATFINSASISVVGPGFTESQALERADEYAAAEVTHRMLDSIPLR